MLQQAFEECGAAVAQTDSWDLFAAMLVRKNERTLLAGFRPASFNLKYEWPSGPERTG